MSLPYFKFYPTEELGNYQIMTLSHEMLGVWYLLRMCQLWQHQGRIPDDPDYIAPVLRLSSEKWITCRDAFVSRGLIQIIDGHVTIATIRKQWEDAQTYMEGQRSKRLEVLKQKREQAVIKKDKNKQKNCLKSNS